MCEAVLLDTQSMAIPNFKTLDQTEQMFSLSN